MTARDKPVKDSAFSAPDHSAGHSRYFLDSPDPPHITVVIPVWDSYVTDFLPNAVASVRAQRGVRADILVIDNHSAVPLPELPGCRVVRTDARLSPGGARNVAAPYVDSEFVMFLDADDRLAPGGLAELIGMLRKYPRKVAVAPTLVDGRGRRRAWPYGWTSRVTPYWRTSAFLEMALGIFPHVSAMRTATFRSTPGYGDAEAAEDWALCVSLLLRGPVALCEDATYVYDSRDDGLWATNEKVRLLREHRRQIRLRVRQDPAASVLMRALSYLLVVPHGLYIARKGFLARRRSASDPPDHPYDEAEDDNLAERGDDRRRDGSVGSNAHR